MSPEFPSLPILAELALEARAQGMELQLFWVPGDQNEEADALSKGEWASARFKAENRMHPDLDNFRVLNEMLELGNLFKKEHEAALEERKRSREVKEVVVLGDHKALVSLTPPKKRAPSGYESRGKTVLCWCLNQEGPTMTFGGGGNWAKASFTIVLDSEFWTNSILHFGGCWASPRPRGSPRAFKEEAPAQMPAHGRATDPPPSPRLARGASGGSRPDRVPGRCPRRRKNTDLTSCKLVV